MGGAEEACARDLPQGEAGRCGTAVQVDPINPTVKASGTKCLKQEYDEALSNFAFNDNLRRYNAERECTFQPRIVNRVPDFMR